MPLKADYQGLGRMRRDMQQMGSGGPVLEGLRRGVTALLTDEFTRGIGPDGQAWAPTVRGKPALLSRKLPSAFKSQFVNGGGGLTFSGEVPRDWLMAHQEGHTFAARSVAGLKQFLTYNAKGQLSKASKVLNKAGQVKRGWRQVFAAAHEIGRRILPQRQIVPEGNELPARWSEALSLAATEAIERWAARARR